MLRKISWMKPRKLFTLVPMAMHGGTLNNCLFKWNMQLRCSRRHIQTVLPSLYLISHQLMPPWALMPSKPLRWTSLMVGSSIYSTTQSFLNQIQLLSTKGKPRRWLFQMGDQKAWSVFLLSRVLMFATCMQSVHQSAHLKILTAVWPGYLANRMISSTKSLCLSLLLNKQDTNVFSYPSSTVSSILSRW